MKEATKTMIRMTLAADDTASPEEVRSINAALEGTAGVPLDKLLSAAEAGALLGRSTRAIRAWAKAGTLPRVTYPGRTRSPGFLESDVRTLLTRRTA